MAHPPLFSVPSALPYRFCMYQHVLMSCVVCASTSFPDPFACSSKAPSKRGPRPPQHTQCKAAMLPTSSAGLRRFMRAPGGALDGTTGVQDVQHKSAAMLQQAQVRARAHMQQHLPASMHPIHPHAVAPPPAYLRTAASLGKDLPTTTRQGWSAAASSAVAAFRASLTYVGCIPPHSWCGMTLLGIEGCPPHAGGRLHPCVPHYAPPRCGCACRLVWARLT